MDEPRRRRSINRIETSKKDDTSEATPSSSSTKYGDVKTARTAVRGTIATFLLRLLSFGFTQWTFRLLDPDTLGKANIQLELLLTSVLFLSREGFRLALTRNVTAKNWNVAWLTIPVVTLVAGSAFSWHGYHYYRHFITKSISANNDNLDYHMAGILYSLASWIEGCAEPAALFGLRKLDVPTRVSAEGLASVAKTLSTVAALQQNRLVHYPVSCLGIAQLVYAIVYSTYLYSKTYPHLVGPSFRFSSLDGPTCYMTAVFTLQGFFKHLLTEADRIVLTAISDNYDQGVYAMGSAYGGMAARILLQPLEENCRLLWSRLAFSPISVSSKNPMQNTEEEEEESSSSKSKSKTTRSTTITTITTKVDPLEQSFTTFAKIVVYIGLVFSCLAVNYTSLLLTVMAGRKWGKNMEAANVLSAFCIYTAFLAWNGTTEAFVYGVTSSGMQLGRLGIAHTVIGIVFAAVAPNLVERYGTIGLVSANCIAMTLRSCYSMYFIVQFFDQRWKLQNVAQLSFLSIARRLLQQMIPHPLILASFAMTWWITNWSWKKLVQQGFYETFHFGNREWLLHSSQHVATGVSCLAGIALVVSILEVELRHSPLSILKRKRD